MIQADDAPLGYLLYRVGAVLRPEVATALSPLGLTLPEFVCLRILSMFPGMSSAELSRHTNVTPQAMNTVLHKLEERRRRGAARIGVLRVVRFRRHSTGRAAPCSKRAEGAVRDADARILAKLTEDSATRVQEDARELGSD